MLNLKQHEIFYIEPDVKKLDIPQYIDRPEYVSNKMAGYSLQALGWMLWLWLLLPLITVSLWLYQGRLIESHLLSSEAENQLHHFKAVAIVILLMMLGLILWASYNWFRFYNVENREITSPIETQDLANFFAVNQTDLEEMIQAKIITIHYDEQGQFVKAEINI